MDDEATVKHYLEMWKQTITVQQHFNDIGWRIRGLALTALTFALGAAAVAAREQTVVDAFGWGLQLSSVVLILGIFLWLAFFFVDLAWYHRLLIGAVRHGEALEKILQQRLPGAGLTIQISHSSPSKLGWGRAKTTLHSTMKLRLFYLSVLIVLVLLAAALQMGASG